ncbi:amino acid ABC transporter substrate-binding protein [Desulfovibrio subterraneus]|uniref:Amino acid ABC transporter substrate-binding protein n=1 Tax=Desulfovibrio subterraneus TaxID=2718620 RepID=A0A7J0BF81_9BACT|nr:transporter substrate-binding domain-containing protein [Desulfovibrio subterraneus]GFM31842.1 amino acid ABC transporter substrate-binding protein [Desulfovibrio subterraneus]
MRRLTGFLTLVLVMCFCLPVQAEKIVLVAPEFPPQIVRTPSVPLGATGAAVDIVAEAMRRADIDFELKTVPWSRAMYLVKNGGADAIVNIYWTQERSEIFDFCTNEMFYDHVYFFTTDASLKWKGDMRSLAGKTVGVVLSYSYGPVVDEALRSGLFPRQIEMYTLAELMESVAAGKVQVAPLERDVAIYLAEQAGFADKLYALGPVGDKIPSYIAFSRLSNLTDVRKKLDKILLQMHHDGTIDSITEKYYRKVNAGS